MPLTLYHKAEKMSRKTVIAIFKIHKGRGGFHSAERYKKTPRDAVCGRKSAVHLTFFKQSLIIEL